MYLKLRDEWRSDLDLHSLLSPVCPSTEAFYYTFAQNTEGWVNVLINLKMNYAAEEQKKKKERNKTEIMSVLVIR